MLRLLSLALLCALSLAQTPTYDILIAGGRIVDGAGNPWFVGDVGIQGDIIAYVGPAGHSRGRLTLDAKGLVVAPGFIDTHSHARRGIFESPAAENQIRQGVTTLIEGPDGSSPLPLKPFLEKLAATQFSVNFGTLVGQGSIREKVIGLKDRKATPEEIAAMRELTRQAMLEGAFGLSTGLFYLPGIFTPTEEVIEIAKVAGVMGGIHTGLPTQITHHKIMGRSN